MSRDGTRFVERRSAEGAAARPPPLAREVVALAPDVIFGTANRAVEALRSAEKTNPIVAVVGDPVGSGSAISLVRPGGNVTGFSIDAGLELCSKAVELRYDRAGFD